jgi:hypothetical protein
MGIEDDIKEIIEDKDGNIEYVEGLISIVYSKKQDLYIFEGDCFINKKNKDYIEIFYDRYVYTNIAKVINNQFVEDREGLYKSKGNLIYNLDVKKYIIKRHPCSW